MNRDSLEPPQTSSLVASALVFEIVALHGAIITAALAPAESQSSPPVPFRVQLSRRRGWRLPANTAVVSRPTKYGNPFDWREVGLEELAVAGRTAA